MNTTSDDSGPLQVPVADDDSASNPRESEGPETAFSRTDAVVVRQPLRPGSTDSVRELVTEQLAAEGLAGLIDPETVATLSLFLDPGDGDRDALVWYVEVTDGEWADPAETLRRRSPLFEAGLTEHLAATSEPRADAVEQLVHAHNPSRPATPEDPDVVMVRLGIKPGVATLGARLLARTLGLLEGTWIERAAQESAVEVLEDERMWTETLWLERSGEEYSIRWYMEADDMDHVIEAYEASDNRVARWSNVVVNRLFEAPLETLGDPMTASEWELLAHETNLAQR